MLPPIALGAIALGVIALIKKRQAGDGTPGVGSGPGGQLDANAGGGKSNSQLATNDAYLAKDIFAIGGTGLSIVGAAAAAAQYAGTTLGQVASNIGNAIAGAAGGLSAGAAFFLIAVAVIVICNQIGATLTAARGMATKWHLLLPNGRHFKQYEEIKLAGIMKALNRDFKVKRVVQDERCEINISRAVNALDHETIHFIGERAEWKTNELVNPPQGTPSFLQLQKASRGLALEYAYQQGRYAWALLKNWGPLIGSGTGNQPYPSRDYYENHLFDDTAGYESDKLGGLNQLPLPGGYTEVTRDDPAQLHPAGNQLRGIETEGYTEAQLPSISAAFAEARFAAFRNVLQTIALDTGFYFPWDPQRYAKDVYNRMELAAPFFLLNGTTITLPYQAWGFLNKDGTRGVHLMVDVVSTKDGNMQFDKYFADNNAMCLEA